MTPILCVDCRDPKIRNSRSIEITLYLFCVLIVQIVKFGLHDKFLSKKFHHVCHIVLLKKLLLLDNLLRVHIVIFEDLGQCVLTKKLPVFQNSAFQPSRGRLLYIHYSPCRSVVTIIYHQFYLHKTFNLGQKPNLLNIWGKVYDDDSLLAPVNNDKDTHKDKYKDKEKRKLPRRKGSCIKA